MKSKFSIAASVVYLFLAGAVLWQAALLYRQLRPGPASVDSPMIDVAILGNVRRPGRYRVPVGTTQFEILQVAGVRPTSDLSNLNLTDQVDSAGRLDVGTLDKPVTAGDESISSRLEFYFGEISVVGGDGRSVPVHEGMTISRGDRILTEASSQAELSMGPFSRLDMDNFAELVFDKIGTDAEEEGGEERPAVEAFQKTGACWYKLVYTKNKESFKVVTGSVTISVGGSGADFLVDVQSDRITINLMDGLLLVERSEGGEAINMISGQTALVFSDGRPFQITKMAPTESVNERFASLSREKVSYISRHMPLNILFCGPPAVFYFINIDYERGSYTVINLPAGLLIEQFANGISTLDEAYLYGGPVMVATFVERILDTRIPKYIVFDKGDIIKFASVSGGLAANIDHRAAGALNLVQGRQKLSDQLLVQYLSSSISGSEDAARRQQDVLYSVFEALQNRSLVPTMLLADQLIGSTETNFGAGELMGHYSRFNEKTNWRYRNLSIPAAVVKRKNRNCFDPYLDQCKGLLASYEQ